MVADPLAEFATVSLPGHARATERDELREYLDAPVVPCHDPIKWWYDNHETYPALSRMARDILSIPPSSTSVERLFSKGRNLLDFKRNRLSARTIRASLSLGSWSSKELITPESLVEALKNA